MCVCECVPGGGGANSASGVPLGVLEVFLGVGCVCVCGEVVGGVGRCGQHLRCTPKGFGGWVCWCVCVCVVVSVRGGVVYYPLVRCVYVCEVLCVCGGVVGGVRRRGQHLQCTPRGFGGFLCVWWCLCVCVVVVCVFV